MNINCKRFRLSTYQDHKVTGLPKRHQLYALWYRSGDNGGRQYNFVLRVLLTSIHFKYRAKAGRKE